MKRIVLLGVGLIAMAVASPAYAIGVHAFAAPELTQVAAVYEPYETNLYALHGSGVLIAPSWVLTAAHVMASTDLADPSESVWLGGQLHQVESVILHPAFDPTDPLPIDLALLRLVDPVLSVTPAVLFDSPDGALALDGQEVRLAGYGPRTLGGSDGGVLRAGDAFIEPLGTTHYMTLPGGAVAFPGDSGGPSFWHDGTQTTVVGIHQFVVPIGNDRFVNIDIHPGAFRPFIDAYVPDAVWTGDLATPVVPAPTAAGATLLLLGALAASRRRAA